MKNFLFWNPTLYTNAENERWSHLRAMEWESFIFYISPVFTPFIVLWKGWLIGIIVTVVIEYIWKIFIEDSYLNLGLSSIAVLIVSYLKWPIAIGFAIAIYTTSHNLVSAIAMLIYPFASLLLQFLEMPLLLIKKFNKNSGVGVTQKRILRKMGFTFDS